MTKRLNHKFILGLSDQSTVKLEFDKVPLIFVKYWAKRTCTFYMLEGFIILQSSQSSFHVVFNLPVSWETNFEIMCWVATMSQLEKLRDYVLLQGRKKSSTLRVGNKGEKPPPTIIFRFGKQDKEINEFLIKRKEIQKIIQI